MNNLIYKTIKENIPEEEVLGKLKFLIAAGNDAQAIRMIEDYGLWKESFMHDKKKLLKTHILVDIHYVDV